MVHDGGDGYVDDGDDDKGQSDGRDYVAGGNDFVEKGSGRVVPVFEVGGRAGERSRTEVYVTPWGIN